jgi:Tfp pilus assembly protein PilF
LWSCFRALSLSLSLSFFLTTGNVVFSLSDKDVINTEQFFLRAINASPTDPLPRFLYARFLTRCNRFERAEDYFLMCLELDPCQARHLRIYGFFLMEHGHMEAAQAVLLRAQFEARLQYEGDVLGGHSRVTTVCCENNKVRC